VPAWDSSHWPLKTVVDTQLETPDVEVVEIAVQSAIAIAGLQMSVILLTKAFAKEITNVTENN